MDYNIIVPTVTIIDDNGKIDIEGNRKVVKYLIENGVSGLAPFGSTGEFTEFTIEEKLELIKMYVEEAKGKVPVIAGTSDLNINRAIEFSNKAKEIGVNGHLMLVPYYFGMSQDDAYNWYSRLAENIDNDIYIYNFPDRTGMNILPETVLKLVNNYKNIVGIKDTVTNPENTKKIIFTVKKEHPNFKVFSGFDNQFSSNMIAGGNGNISALSNVAPKLWVSLVYAANKKDYEKVFKYQAKIEKLMPLYGVKSNFSQLFKMLMKENGLDIKTNAIFPFNDTTQKDVEYAKKILGDNND